jgi:hypothetical protein
LKDINPPAVTHCLVGAFAICLIEFDALVRRLCEVVGDGSVLDHEPAEQEEMWLFRHDDVPNAADNCALASVRDICCEQTFLASRLLAVAEPTVHDLAADIDERGRAPAVARALFSVAAAIEPIAVKVVQGVPAHERASLLASRKASREQNERHRALVVGPK